MTVEGAILVRGQPIACEAPVRTWHETGLKFPATKRRAETRVCLAHWTGAENPPDRVHANMMARRLSVHFVIDAAGVVWQMLDADVFGAHCQGANAYSVGMEIINRGNGLTLPDRGVVRPILRERIHGVWTRYAGFTKAQVASCLALCESLCRAYGLPMAVPTRAGEVLATTMTAAEAKRFRGCAGHMHFERGKVDCGVALLEAIRARGVELAGPGVA
jgi:hypothetical protein